MRWRSHPVRIYCFRQFTRATCTRRVVIVVWVGWRDHCKGAYTWNLLSTQCALKRAQCLLGFSHATTCATVVPPVNMLANATTTAFFARVTYAVVLANATTTTFFTCVTLAVVLANTTTTTFYTRATHAVVLANAATTAFFTRVPHAVVLANTTTTAFFARVTYAVVYAKIRTTAFATRVFLAPVCANSCATTFATVEFLSPMWAFLYGRHGTCPHTRPARTLTHCQSKRATRLVWLVIVALGGVTATGGATHIILFPVVFWEDSPWVVLVTVF